MTEHDELPEREEAVRRMLADVRHDEPAPPEVVGRLDAVLADLTAERRETAPVVELAAARRRRRAASLVLAAAAVVAVGVGMGQLRAPVGEDASTAGSADSEVFRAPSEGGGLLDDDASPRPAPRTLVPPIAVPLSSDTLEADLLRARGTGTSAGVAASRGGACVVPDGGDQVAVTLDGDPGVAVFRVPRGERQRVDVFLCGEIAPAGTVLLPAP